MRQHHLRALSEQEHRVRAEQAIQLKSAFLSNSMFSVFLPDGRKRGEVGGQRRRETMETRHSLVFPMKMAISEGVAKSAHGLLGSPLRAGTLEDISLLPTA